MFSWVHGVFFDIYVQYGSDIYVQYGSGDIHNNFREARVRKGKVRLLFRNR